MRRRQGHGGSRPPYGWAAIGAGRECFIPVPEQMTVLRRIRELYDADATRQAIADDLNAKGYRTQMGGNWNIRTVYSALQNITRFGIPEDIEAATNAAYEKAEERIREGAKIRLYSGRRSSA